MGLLVKDIMATGVHTVSPDMSVTDLDHELFDNGISGAPVIEGGKVVGVVSRSDISHELALDIEEDKGEACYYYASDGRAHSIVIGGSPTPAVVLEKARQLTVKDIMTTKVISIDSSATPSDVGKLMVDHHIHRVLIIDDEELVGLVSTLDVIKVLA